MLTPDQINTLHRLHSVEKWSARKIAAHLHLGRRTIAKYLDTPSPPPVRRDRASKLDPFKAAIAELLEQDPDARATVITQRRRTLGYDGGETIVRDHLRAIAVEGKARRAYVRVEPGPGERFDIDWGHFGALTYGGAPRKLYAFRLVEAHSRKMYLEFTHSQSFETFARCHIHAFDAFGGCARECWYDNLATAVAEHDGNLVRFNPRFLGLAREYGFIPRACHVRAAWEKGKVERAIGYIRQNFWPLRSFSDLNDVNSQARRRVEEIANRRKHRETGQAHEERFRAEFLSPVPLMAPDYRDTAEVIVHKDLRLSFDGNRYCVPPRYVGQKLTVKATAASVSVYDQSKEIVTYSRCWERGQTFGAERFQKELFAQLAAAQRTDAQQRLVKLRGPTAEYYLRKLAETDRSLARQVRELLELVRDYGTESVSAAVEKAYAAQAFGSDYIANILRQREIRRDVQPPLRLKHPELNSLATDPLSLAEYDAFILHPRKDSHDLATGETQSTQPHHDEPPVRASHL
ncbi:MAG: IS21 family transposase [Acidobacteria bacterium]|nr:IS21 family transposase [Acidobacteriota bacterium]